MNYVNFDSFTKHALTNAHAALKHTRTLHEHQ